MVPELHAMRIVCLLKAITPAWDTNTVPSSLVIDYTRCCDSFEILQAKVKCFFIGRARETGPACLKQTLLCARWADYCIFHVFYLGLLGEHLGQVS